MTPPCRCKHHRLTHTYTREGNAGPCLAIGCRCDRYHEVPPMPHENSRKFAGNSHETRPESTGNAHETDTEAS